jgi:hypothetical protein
MSNGADTYYTTGLQSDVRNVGYPTVDDEQTERLRSHHRTSSHPYQRDQPSISSIMQGSRGGDGYVDGIASVSRLSRQVRLRAKRCCTQCLITHCRVNPVPEAFL